MTHHPSQARQASIIIDLNREQRLRIFSDTGAYVRRAGYSTDTGALDIIDQTCSSCLLSSDLFGVVIMPDGRCNKCHDFEQKQNEGIFHSALVHQTIEACRGKNQPDCILAYSGGKDSAAALLTAVYIYNLKPHAVLVDNGFIPQEVIDASHRFCHSHGVPLTVKKIDIIEFTRNSLKEGSQTIPCQSCIKQVFENMAEACREKDTRLVIGGHRFPPLVFSIQAYTMNPVDDGIICISPLLGLRIPEEKQLQWIKDQGWVAIEIAGNTSNCKLIGYVEEHHYNRFGYNPHIYEVSKEIRAGFYDRQKGVLKLENHHVSAEHRQEVESKLALT